MLTCEDLAKEIARDGEGATKLIEAQVQGAKNNLDANVIAKKIVGSNLVKTAVYGTDANWGRIIGAIGHSAAQVTAEEVEVYLATNACLRITNLSHSLNPSPRNTLKEMKSPLSSRWMKGTETGERGAVT